MSANPVVPSATQNIYVYNQPTPPWYYNRGSRFMYYNPAWTTFYNKLYPRRKCLLACGICLILLGIVLFIATPITAASSRGMNPGIPIMGFLGVFLMFGGCVSIQFSAASSAWHSAQSNVQSANTVFPPGSVMTYPGQANSGFVAPYPPAAYPPGPPGFNAAPYYQPPQNPYVPTANYGDDISEAKPPPYSAVA